MRWQSHVLIGAALGTIISPLAVPAAILGSTAPDWMEMVAKPFRRIKHRTTTHIVLYWIALVLFFKFVGIDWRGFGLGFAVGGLSHVLADSFTIAGVPFSPWSDARFHLFGGKLRTGNGGEYVFSAVICLICFGWGMYSPDHKIKRYIENNQPSFFADDFSADREQVGVRYSNREQVDDDFTPYFHDQKRLYEMGLIDAAEWKEKRMKYF